ncbi:MAG: methyltransferase [Candidatus Glassbacteria bacterium RIFCSPLOWO2_12_FULL_58_11]|uniref:Methyltransferase n=1 Tax=Candidatus Glassbacteria bacterium RIFCSPLOWO2_12_FULL_58_11 TaxID=1817867 RepID=A0A1F5YSW6_9BACT|nr:MAG: methyltransferase [Candidatus Glassbacteria bacterium RIFCSPLOWO2_12_FULL_58_11]
MTSREVVRAALNHSAPARVPVDFGSTGVTGMHVSCVATLRDYYGLEKRPVKVHEPYQMLGLIEADLQEVLGLDVEGVFPPRTMFGFPNERWKPWRMYDGLEVLVSADFVTTVGENGDTLIYPEGDRSAPPSGRMPKGGYFFDSILRQEPLDEANLDPQDNLEEFGQVSESDLRHFKKEAGRAASTGRAVIATFGGTALGDIALVPGPFMKHPKGIRDVTEWYISTLTRQDYIHKIYERQTEIALANLEKLHAAVGELVDAVFVCGTDFGGQSSLICSPDIFRELYLPYYKQINGWIHSHTAWKTFKHSCGAVEPLLEYFIGAGFDILNPVQCSAAGMEAEGLKSRYGSRLTFWGGGVDTQKVLPFGTPLEVREQVLRRCEIFSGEGGFVFNTIHNVQAKTPVENLAALFAALKEFNGQR